MNACLHVEEIKNADTNSLHAPTKGLKNIKVAITKFGCTVPRSTADEAKHFNSKSKQ